MAQVLSDSGPTDMRIVVLSDLPPFVLGGAEQQVKLLTSAWMHAGVEVLVLGHRTPTGIHNRVPVERILVIRRFGRFVRALTFSVSLAVKLLKQRNVDLIYCRFLGEAALVTAILKELGLLRLPLFVTPAAAGQGMHSDIARLRSMWMSKRLIALVRRQVDAFNAISDGVADELESARLTVTSRIPNGVRAAPPESRQVGSEASRHWLFVGRLSVQKGVDLLLEAIALLKAQRINVELRIVGDGPEASSLLAQRDRLGLQGRVHFLGRMTHEDTLALLPQARALVLPSRYEGLSNAALEALAAGTPVVATRCDGIDRYLGDGIGWICDASASSIAEAIAESSIETTESYLVRRQRCRTLAADRFSVTACAAAHLTLFRALCEKHPAHGGKSRCNDRPSHRG
jgi:glycosyltransferase involved in cell wall biosynthesis